MPTPSAPQRLQALTHHLTTTTTTSTMSTGTKPPITCHVLDTTIGKPASSIPVLLTLHNPPSTLSPSTSTIQFSSTTNADGRVTAWKPHTPFLSQTLEEVYHAPGEQRWGLTFDTEAYFKEQGREGFFWEVDVKFVVKEKDGEKEKHYHVPVLLGGFGYSTYRGS